MRRATACWLVLGGSGKLEQGQPQPDVELELVPARRTSRSMNRYRLSTFSRAHGVLRRTFRLDAMLGSLLKQRIALRQVGPAVALYQGREDGLQCTAVQGVAQLDLRYGWDGRRAALAAVVLGGTGCGMRHTLA